MIYAILILAIIGVGTWLMVRRKKAKRVKQHEPIYSVDIPVECYSGDAYHRSENGVVVRSYIPVSIDALAKIESGIAHTLRNTEYKNWNNFRNLTDFQVFLVPPATHNVETDPGSPALKVKVKDASGNLFEIQAAGTCIGVPGAIIGYDDNRYASIVLPYEETELPDHAQYLEESARNEAEHICLFANDLAAYLYYTGPNDQHPIFADA